MFEWNASLPPRRITALPAIRQSAAASLVTLGRASKMMPITPIGTVTFSIFRPFGRVSPLSTRPTGSRCAATSSTPCAIASMRASVSVRRSSIASRMPLSRAAARSTAFAARISGAAARSACAAFSSARRFFSPAVRSTAAASFGAAPIF